MNIFRNVCVCVSSITVNVPNILYMHMYVNWFYLAFVNHVNLIYNKRHFSKILITQNRYRDDIPFHACMRLTVGFSNLLRYLQTILADLHLFG